MNFCSLHVCRETYCRSLRNTQISRYEGLFSASSTLTQSRCGSFGPTDMQPSNCLWIPLSFLPPVYPLHSSTIGPHLFELLRFLFFGFEIGFHLLPGGLFFHEADSQAFGVSSISVQLFDVSRSQNALNLERKTRTKINRINRLLIDCRDEWMTCLQVDCSIIIKFSGSIVSEYGMNDRKVLAFT